MNRDKNLIAQIVDPDNLRLAYWKAQRGKSDKHDVVVYQKGLDKHLALLRRQILDGRVDVGGYNYFIVYDPKERQICAAAFAERVLHHALMQFCHNNFEKYQIFDSYASRLEKGTYSAIERAAVFNKKYKWFLKLDVRKYFYSIDHKVLKDLLERRFKEKKLLLILSEIIDSYHTEKDKGLPIGNLTSQYFANHYLAVSDHYAKEAIGISAYVRYMDDMVLWSDDKAELIRAGNRLEKFIENRLLLKLKPFCLNATQKGLPFLGYMIYPDVIRLNRNSKKRFRKKLNIYEYNLRCNHWSQSDYQRHVLPLIAFARHSDSFGFRAKCLQALKYG